MINLDFRLSWPFKFDEEFFKKYFSFHWSLTKNKTLEIEANRASDTLFGFELRFSPLGQDHAGLYIELEFLRRSFELKIYDNRHWNYAEHRWYTPEEFENETRNS